MFHDLRLAFRALLKSPAFAFTTIAVLALGIGANSAIFSLVNQLLLRPEGISDPSRVVAIRAKYEKLNMRSISVSGPDFKDVRDGTRVFECAAATSGGDYNYTGGSMPERLQGAQVSARFFDVFGATPLLGRTFVPDEDHENASPVVVLSHAAWVRMFGADPTIVGRTIPLNQKPYKIVGVMKADFRWPRQVEVWVPLALPAKEFTEDYRFNEHLQTVARMRPGVSFAQADAFIRLAADRVRNGSDDNARFARDARWGMFALPLVDYLASDTRTPMLVLMAAVVFVLLIACSNVAGLMVARAAARVSEIAVRSALGATRWQILRQTVAESVTLAFVGGILGLGLAYAGTAVLLSVAPEEAVIGLTARIDAPVLLFTLLAVCVSALLAAAAPAWQAARIAPYEHIKSGSRSGTGGGGRQRLRAGLVVSEATLAVVLLVGAGLLIRSLGQLQNVNPGFDPHGVVTARLALPRAQYGDEAKRVAFFRALTGRLASVRGVAVAAAGVPLPFSGDNSSASFAIEGRVVAPGDPGPHGDVRLVTPGYFAALGIPLKRGRLFTDQDRKETAPVVIVDESLARQYWPGQDPIGKHMKNGGPKDPWATIVGEVGHVKHSDLAADTGKGVYYYPLYQEPAPFASIVVRTSAETGSVAPAIRQAVHDVDPNQPVHGLRSMDDLVSASLAPRRFAMRLLAFFAFIALFMAALGLYGVISYSVTQRTAEIGIRLALGAPHGGLRWMVVRQGLRLAGVGVVIGVAAALASSRVLISQLYGVRPFDPVTLAGTVIALLAAALLASYLPARTATRVDPLTALRAE